jgi:hypothetical protein
MSGDKPLRVYGNIQNSMIVRDQQNSNGEMVRYLSLTHPTFC